MNKKRTALRILAHSGLLLFTVLLVLLLAAYSVMAILVHGPSPTARRLFVLSVKETSAAGFLANLYLSEEEIAEILASDDEEKSGSDQDFSLISIPDKGEAKAESDISEITLETLADESVVRPETDMEQVPQNTTPVVESDSLQPTDGIEVLDIEGSTYNGKMLVISDPTRVFVGVPDSYGESSYGLTVASMIKKYGAVAGTNAGGFYDPNGQGTGGIPEGIVIYEGKLLWGNLTSIYSIAGIDKSGILHVGSMTGQQAMDKGVQYAASFGPALVMNGEAAGGKRGLGGGLNPRTAIGQRADGAILLLVINGRSLDSLGATLDDLAAIMLEHGAVNATNLDGGSSSIMIMNGEYLTSSAYIFGERVVATAILVKEQ